MKSLKDLLNKKKASGPLNLDDQTVFYVFRKIIKEEFGNVGAGNLKADFFKNKTLFIKSESSVWLSELWMNREKVMRKMNKELGEDAVKNIKTK
ncbi:MAG: hypothetical protein QG620_184 [Patescibacteria group bacterium]|nr:hypothetical protein [Patescibacteria group bacterium]